MISLQRYAALFSHRDIARTFAISLLGRLPIGLTGLAILLLAQTSSGSFAQGGAAAACYVVGLGAVAPFLGRAIDRYGPRRILIGTGVLFPAALIALVFAGDAAAWTLALAGPRARAFRRSRSACAPTSADVSSKRACSPRHTRASRWPRRQYGSPLSARSLARCSFFTHRRCALGRSSHARRAACSVLSPNAVSRRLSSWCCVSRARSGSSRSAWWRMQARLCSRHSRGFSSASRAPAGSALGGFAYGSRGWHYPLGRQFVAALAVMAVGLGTLALGWHPWLFAPWAALAGVAMAPVG